MIAQLLNTKFLFACFLIAWIPQMLVGQFAGPIGHFTSNGIAKDSSSIIAWATNCTVERGYLNIANPSSGIVSSGLESNAIGAADEIGTVTLGDSGVAVLTFEHPIFNGSGPDFAVFENAFSDNFLELAFVEVSSDGINYFRFPATSNMQNSVQIGPFEEVGEATKINNLAGKYRSGYGTPFDLEQLSGINGLNINAVTHVKVIDVVGSINPNYGTQDQNGNYINDPYPTDFEAGGFDLDAVAVLYQYGVNSVSEKTNSKFSIFPNPTNGFAKIEINLADLKNIHVKDLSGKIVSNSIDNNLDLNSLQSGTYLVQIELKDGSFSTERIIKQ